jgi:putative endonuclease
MPRAPRPPTARQQLGAAGERAALTELEQAGLRLLARNVRSRHGEIDLVMLEGATLVFIEVRTRAGPGRGGALGSVGAAKQARLLRAASEFLATHPEHAQRACRIDVVGYDGHGDSARCLWVRGAFEARY